MGRPSKQALPGDPGDTMSLHSNVPPYRDRSVSPAGAPGSSTNFRSAGHGLNDDGDDDNDVPQLDADDDLPPMYTDVAESNALLGPQQAPITAADDSYDSVPIFFVDQNNGNETYIDPRLDASPELLERHIKAWAQTPPRLRVQIKGTHSELVEEHGKKERRAVVDFDVSVELTPYLYKNVITRESWSELRTVENAEKARRGTVFACRAPKGNILDGQKPSLREWVHRYCAGSSSGLKAFVLRRRVVGLDREHLRDRLIHLVRSTNYHGDVTVYFPYHKETVSVYNSCRTNHWRSTQWIVIVCYITLTFLLTWPYLFFRTKRFETVFANWYFSRQNCDESREYVSLSEDHIFSLWAPAIQTAVLSKRQCLLDQQDLVNSQSQAGPPATGNTAVDAGLNVVMAGIRAMNEVNRQMGWGYDR
ncbi:hypothetical protein MAPG_07645 [Magnaporthiopsis poae ATCC 64411]|uniref:Uncharacterized protein n=1 Tax=Magnaporthiopsis poae (strain ATCC 64411 / 73-15) TaxID=644358 RepID=A0A0C4E580_MAGP6|nr:hypothetical protein MAPG_07645 [Magnaporthiopsis poae ATCC 64411]